MIDLSKEDEMLAELKKIRALLEKPPVAPARKGLWGEFMDFLSKYQIMGLAAGFIIAIYLGALVLALVKDFIMPIIGLILNPLGMGNLADAAKIVSSQKFAYGDFILALITFLIVAFVVFLLVKITKRWGIQ